MIVEGFHFNSWGQRIARFALAEIPDMPSLRHFEDFAAFGRIVNETLVAAFVLHQFRGRQCNVTVAAPTAGAITRDLLRSVFGFAFRDMNLTRVTSMVGASNHQARKLAERLGAIDEGRLRKGYDGTEDAVIYGLLNEECKWVSEVRDD